MGLILAFPAAGRKTAAQKPVAGGSAAEILFFTGVRYMRREPLISGNDGDAPINGTSRRRTQQRRRPAKRA